MASPVLTSDDIMNSPIRNAVTSLLLLVLVACGDQQPVPQLELAQSPPPVAAEFRTTVQSAQGVKSSAQWRFWRSHDRIERENPVGAIRGPLGAR